MTVNIPEKMNALSPLLMREIWSALDELEGEECLQAIIITGAGEEAFISGADLEDFENLNPLRASNRAVEGQAFINRIASCRVPTIAAVNGYALGGGFEICLACDFVIASQNARFGFPEVRLGMIPGWGGTQRLARLIGPRIAKELILTGALWDAGKALSVGIVNQVVPAEDLFTAVFSLVEELGKGGRFALRQAKLAIDRGLDMGYAQALELEIECLSSCFFSDEPKKRIQAFRNKKSVHKRVQL